MQVFKHRLNTGLNTVLGVQKLLYLDYQDTKLYGWFLTDPDASEYEVYVALTGEHIPDEYRYVTSTQLHINNGYYVIHAFD